MRSAQYIFATVLTFALAGTAAAQTTPPSTATTQPTYVGETVSHWVASGFVGGGFSTTSDDPRIDNNNGGVTYGGQVAYLWRGIVGPEFLAEWAPSFDITSALIDGNTHVSNYMFNAIGAIPLGADGQIQPYVSGGWGRTQLRADLIARDGSVHSNSNGTWGSNIGGGIMAFANNRFGVRGDVRYYHGNDVNDVAGTVEDQFVESLVSGLSYWRASGGISFRW
jgi:hypothetical protein